MSGNKDKYFYSLNSVGWFLYFLIFTLPFIFQYRQLNIVNYLGYFGGSLAGFISSSILRYQLKRKRIIDNLSSKDVVRVLLYVLFASVFWEILDTIFDSMIYGFDQIFSNRFLINFLYDLVMFAPVMFAWSAIYLGIKLWQEWDEQKRKNDMISSLAMKAKLEMLRYQLNPHFIFNALASVRILIEKDKEKAKEMITKLSEFIRYSLIGENLQLASLGREIDVVKSYLEIEKIRFGDNLKVSFEIENGLSDYPIPNFIIHPLVDNAIKHGFNGKTNSLLLKIVARKNKYKGLEILVVNNGFLKRSENDNYSGTNIGLTNIKERLECLYGENYYFSINQENDKVIVLMRIPRISKGQDET